ncbi:MAG TPA: hypothetical protein VFQ30_01560 [Ktedonobacteraceae bacterium]|nr:hypothetical protein [Ktedonobacteraceae bacterium]
MAALFVCENKSTVVMVQFYNNARANQAQWEQTIGENGYTMRVIARVRSIFFVSLLKAFIIKHPEVPGHSAIQ